MKAVIASLVLTVVSLLFGNSLIQIFKKDSLKRAKEFHRCLAVITFLIAIYLVKIPGIWSI